MSRFSKTQGAGKSSSNPLKRPASNDIGTPPRTKPAQLDQFTLAADRSSDLKLTFRRAVNLVKKLIEHRDLASLLNHRIFVRHLPSRTKG